jgi:hypothetical protein
MFRELVLLLFPLFVRRQTAVAILTQSHSIRLRIAADGLRSKTSRGVATSPRFPKRRLRNWPLIRALACRIPGSKISSIRSHHGPSWNASSSEIDAGNCVGIQSSPELTLKPPKIKSDVH